MSSVERALGRSMLQHGRSMDATWNHGCSMDAAWTQHGCSMDARWTQHGCKMDAAWMQHGCNTDATRPARVEELGWRAVPLVKQHRAVVVAVCPRERCQTRISQQTAY